MSDELEEAPVYPADGREADGSPTIEDIEEALKDVIDPELGINVVDLGLLYGVTLDGASAVIDMTLTSAACPLTDIIEEQTARALEGLVASMRINWVWLPPWGPERITADGREMLQALGFNVCARAGRRRTGRVSQPGTLPPRRPARGPSMTGRDPLNARRPAGGRRSRSRRGGARSHRGRRVRANGLRRLVG